MPRKPNITLPAHKARTPAPKPAKRVQKAPQRAKPATKAAKATRPRPAPPPALPPKNGRPPHVPTPKDRVTVKLMVGGGIEQARIAALLGISVRTLTRAYGKEITTGAAELELTVIAAHLKAIKAGNVPAIKWFEQARMGWAERVIVEGDRPPAQPMRVIVELVGDPPPVTYDQGKPRRPFDVGKHVQLLG